MRRLRSESGQGAVENMLVISVVVIGVVSAAYAFVPTFQMGVQGLSTDVSSILSSGNIGGVGIGSDGGGVTTGGFAADRVAGGPMVNYPTEDAASDYESNADDTEGNGLGHIKG